VDDRQSPANSDRENRRYSSPGEELVYREMMEQQARETELRQHWKQVRSFYFITVNNDVSIM